MNSMSIGKNISALIPTVNKETYVILHKNPDMSIGKRMKEARGEAGLSQKALAAKAGVSQPAISQLETGESGSATNIGSLAAALGVNALWLETGKGPKRPDQYSAPSVQEPKQEYATHPKRRAADFELVPEEDSDLEVGRIEYWDAKGSCGGGFLNYEELPKGHLVKEMSFFRKYSLKPENAFAIYADGNSNADFIVDGDIVIFDKSKTEPQSGKIFCIEHPDGLRIKVLRRSIDGSWSLESKNPDKRAYPDERIPPGQEHLLKIRGEFVYRQGG